MSKIADDLKSETKALRVLLERKRPGCTQRIATCGPGCTLDELFAELEALEAIPGAKLAHDDGLTLTQRCLKARGLPTDTPVLLGVSAGAPNVAGEEIADD